jgi:hypothetical protein
MLRGWMGRYVGRPVQWWVNQRDVKRNEQVFGSDDFLVDRVLI